MPNESMQQAGDREPAPPSLEHSANILNATKAIFEKLATEEKKGFVYAVMGGTALQAFSNMEYNPIRHNGTLRDIDILVLNDPHHVAPQLQASFDQHHNENQSMAPRASMKVVREETYSSQFQLISMLKKTESGYALVFRDVTKDVPPELFAPVLGHLQTRVGALSFTTLHPKTLLHLYITVIGSMRPKDAEKLRAFAKETTQRVTNIVDIDDISHEKYKVFHEYAREMRQRYPVYTTAVKVFDYLDSAFFGTFGVHTLPTKLFRKLIDL